MKRETVKALLENGVLQAYADGKEIQYQNNSGLWINSNNADFSSYPNRYRIKPTPQFKVGDLVRTKNNTVCKIKEYLRDETYGVTPLGRDFSLCFRVKDLTPVREVRTPLTFEQAVKLVAEHGVRLLNSRTIASIESDKIRFEDSFSLPYTEACLYDWRFEDGAKFYNATYEEIE